MDKEIQAHGGIIPSEDKDIDHSVQGTSGATEGQGSIQKKSQRESDRSSGKSKDKTQSRSTRSTAADISPKISLSHGTDDLDLESTSETSSDDTCACCGLLQRDHPNEEGRTSGWLGCDSCNRWCVKDCLRKLSIRNTSRNVLKCPKCKITQTQLELMLDDWPSFKEAFGEVCTQVSNIESQLCSQSSRLKLWKDKVKKLNDDISANEAEITRLREKNEDLRKKLDKGDRLRKKYDKVREDYDTVKQYYKEVSLEVDEWKDKFKVEKRDNEELRMKLDALQSRRHHPPSSSSRPIDEHDYKSSTHNASTPVSLTISTSSQDHALQEYSTHHSLSEHSLDHNNNTSYLTSHHTSRAAANEMQCDQPASLEGSHTKRLQSYVSQSFLSNKKENSTLYSKNNPHLDRHASDYHSSNIGSHQAPLLPTPAQYHALHQSSERLPVQNDNSRFDTQRKSRQYYAHEEAASNNQHLYDTSSGGALSSQKPSSAASPARQ